MQNLLRTYRKRTEITIDDVSRLLKTQDSSTISRMEKGLRKPSLEIILTYHLLFDASCERIMNDELKVMAERFHANIPSLVDDLRKHGQTHKVQSRISYLSLLQDKMKQKI